MNISPEMIVTLIINVFGLVYISSNMSAKMERRFTKLETHMIHIMRKLNMAPRDEDM